MPQPRRVVCKLANSRNSSRIEDYLQTVPSERGVIEVESRCSNSEAAPLRLTYCWPLNWGINRTAGNTESGHGGAAGYYFGNYASGSFNWLITDNCATDPRFGFGIESNRVESPLYRTYISIVWRSSELRFRHGSPRLLAAETADRGAVSPHFSRMKLILRDAGAQTSSRPLARQFFPAPLPLFVSSFHYSRRSQRTPRGKDVDRWLLSERSVRRSWLSFPFRVA